MLNFEDGLRGGWKGKYWFFEFYLIVCLVFKFENIRIEKSRICLNHKKASEISSKGF
jgi:hypothetical protein